MNLSKTLSKRTLLTAALAGFAFFLAFFFYFDLGNQTWSDSAPFVANTKVFHKQEQEQEKADSGLPVRLKIPKINVDAAVDPMGTTPSGAMEIPSGSKNVGWYKFGPHPGDNGSAVIDGHYGRWKNGEGSVFDDLNNLEKGDILYIDDEKGATTTFVVRESRKYDPNADASDIFESSDGKAHLNLITCEGIWDKASKSYSQRLVVFTDKE